MEPTKTTKTRREIEAEAVAARKAERAAKKAIKDADAAAAKAKRDADKAAKDAAKEAAKPKPAPVIDRHQQSKDFYDFLGGGIARCGRSNPQEKRTR